MPKSIGHHHNYYHHRRREQHFELSPADDDEYGRDDDLSTPSGNDLLDDMDNNRSYDDGNSDNYEQAPQIGADFLNSLMMDDNDDIGTTTGDNNGHTNFVYQQPHGQQQYEQQQQYHMEFVLPQSGAVEDMLLHNSTSTIAPLLDVSALLQQVSTTFVPSLAHFVPSTTNASSSSSLLLSLLPSSSSPSTVTTASRDNIKTIKVVAYCYILPVVCVLGIIGNLMNVITLASPRLRAVSYMYLRALAIADLLCMCFVLTFATFEVLKEVVGLPIDRHPMFGFYQAHMMLSFINWTLSTGVLIVVALSLERYVSVVFPLHFRAWNSPQRALKAIIVAYVVPAVFYIPYGIGRYSVKKSEAPNGDVFFYPDDSVVSKTIGWQVYKWTREGLLRFLPIVILFVLNSQIMVAFRRRQKMFNRLRNRDQTTIARDDTLLYILGGIAAMFFVCNIPAAINLLFINETVKKRLDYQIFRAMANLLEITNHAAQFYIFCVCSSDYRITFMQKFPCLRAHYITPKFYSYIRNVPKRSGAERSGEGTSDGRAGPTSVRPMMRRTKSERGTETAKYDDDVTGGGRSTEGMMACMRSTTVTAELASTCCGEGKAAERDTMDSQVQLASEESLSDESDTLLNNNISSGSNSSSRSDGRQTAETQWQNDDGRDRGERRHVGDSNRTTTQTAETLADNNGGTFFL